MTRAVTYDLADESIVDTALSVCASALQRGECIVLNVDGTWCVVADAFSPAGTASLLNARRRGRGAPLPILIKDSTVAYALWSQVDADAAALMRRFWPGPLTLIGRPGTSLVWDLAAAGRVASVSARMPQDEFVQRILSEVGPCTYLACPPAHSADELRLMIGDDASVYVTPAVPTSVQATTVVDVRGYAPILVRAGAIAADELRKVCPALTVSEA